MLWKGIAIDVFLYQSQSISFSLSLTLLFLARCVYSHVYGAMD